MKQQLKQTVNKIMYRLFGHEPFGNCKENRFRFANNDGESQYGIFDYNSKPFDL
jgi:hypothetical protein